MGGIINWVEEEETKGEENWEVTRCLMTVIKCRVRSESTYFSGTSHLNQLETTISKHKPEDGSVDIEKAALQHELKELNWEKAKGLEPRHRGHWTGELE